MRIAATSSPSPSLLHVHLLLLLLLLDLLRMVLHHVVLLKVVLLLHRMWHLLWGMHMLLMFLLLMRHIWKLLLRLVWIRRNRLAWCRWSWGPWSLGSDRAIRGRTRNASTGTWWPPLARDHAWLRTEDAELRVVARTVASSGSNVLGRTPGVVGPHRSHGPLTDKSSRWPWCSLRNLPGDGPSGADESRGSRWRGHGQWAGHGGSHARLLRLGRALLVLGRPAAAWCHWALRLWLHSHRAECVVILIDRRIRIQSVQVYIALGGHWQIKTFLKSLHD